jgi:hypothetical protein
MVGLTKHGYGRESAKIGTEFGTDRHESARIRRELRQILMLTTGR